MNMHLNPTEDKYYNYVAAFVAYLHLRFFLPLLLTPFGLLFNSFTLGPNLWTDISMGPRGLGPCM